MKNVDMELVEGVDTPWNELAEWQKKANKYTCTLLYDGKHFVTPFFTGSAWIDVPTWMDVLGSLIGDARCYEGARDFTDFCNDFGYDTDSIRARETYNSCKRTSETLPQIFGDDLEEIANFLMEEGY